MSFAESSYPILTITFAVYDFPPFSEWQWLGFFLQEITSIIHHRPTHIIAPASFIRSVFILVWLLLQYILPSRTDFPRRECHVCSEDGDSDLGLTRDQSRLRLFQLNPPKKINTAGSASAACNNTIRGKGREFGWVQKHTFAHLHTKMTFMVWMVRCGSGYTL